MEDTNPSRDSSDSDESEGDGGATASAIVNSNSTVYCLVNSTSLFENPYGREEDDDTHTLSDVLNVEPNVDISDSVSNAISAIPGFHDHVNANNSNILVQGDLQIREELPIQETTVRETIIESILRANILQPHVDFSPQIEISPYDIDLGGMRGCLTCFQNPVTVQNWPCGCICNCGLCAMVMRVCAQCNGRIEGYTLKR